MLSRKIANIAPSLTLELTGKIADLKRQGEDIITFNLGEPDFGTPDNICAAAKRAIDAQKTKYTAIAGITELREAICEKLQRDNGVSYKASEIVVGTGAKQPLVDAVLTLVDEGDEVLVPVPCYVSYLEMIKLAGGVPIKIQSREEDGFDLNVDAIEGAITPKTRAIIINTPNNPTGAVYSEKALRALGELAVKHDFYIISDEVYEKLIYEGEPHFCVAAASEAVRDHSVIINGFSKAYSMTGWRIGYAAGRADIIKGMVALQGHVTSNANSITQYAALEALRGPQNSVEEMKNEFNRRRLYLLRRLEKMRGVRCVKADGAFYLLPNVTWFYGRKAGERTISDSFDLANYLLEEAKVAIMPGGAFEAPEHLRISYSNSMENLIIGMDRMEAVLNRIR